MRMRVGLVSQLIMAGCVMAGLGATVADTLAPTAPAAEQELLPGERGRYAGIGDDGHPVVLFVRGEPCSTCYTVDYFKSFFELRG